MVQYTLEEIIKALREELERQKSQDESASLSTIKIDESPVVVRSFQEARISNGVPASNLGLRFYIRRCLNEPGYCMAKFRVFLRDKGFRTRCYSVVSHAISNMPRKFVRFLYKIPILGYLIETIVDICRLPILLRNIRIQQMELTGSQIARMIQGKADRCDVEQISQIVQSKADRGDVQQISRHVSNSISDIVRQINDHKTAFSISSDTCVSCLKRSENDSQSHSLGSN